MTRVVGVELRKLNNLIARKVSKAMKDSPYVNITKMHINMIDYLMEAGPAGVLQRDIQQAFVIRKSTTSRILKLMEKNGMIQRISVEHDARLKKIVLTKDAVQRYQNMKQFAEKLDLLITQGIPEKDLQVFFTVLEKMQQNLNE